MHQRWIGLVVSLLGTSLANFDMSFTVYSIALKETFNYTQSQVEFVASMGTVGVGLGFVEIFITRFLGYTGSYLVLCSLSSLSCFLLYIIVVYRHIFFYCHVFVGMAQLLTNVMNNGFLLLVLNIGVLNCPRPHIGKIVGLYLAVSATGKLFYTGLYQLFFTGDLEGYFLFISLTWLLVYGTCGVFHRPVPTDEKDNLLFEELTETTADLPQKLLGDGNDHAQKVQDGGAASERSLQEVFQSPYFHLMFWSSALFQACVMTCLNNLTVIANTTRMHDPLRLVYVVSASIFTVRLLFGAIFDLISTKTCGFALLLISYVIFLAAMVLGLTVINERTIYVMTLFVGVGLGAGNSISLSMLVRLFGKQHYDVISGSFYLVFTVFTVLLQTVIGLIYDIYTTNSEIFCYGPDCFLWSFVALFALTLTVLGVQICNMILVTGSKDSRK